MRTSRKTQKYCCTAKKNNVMIMFSDNLLNGDDSLDNDSYII